MSTALAQPEPERAPGVARQAAETAAIALLFLLGAICLQWLGGAFQSEFSGHADEPAHYVTGLMVRDYIAAGLPGSPVRFAQNYYLHYPKVALGHWPPVFYCVEAGWMLVFGVSRASVLLLMAVLTASLAATLYRAIRTEFGARAGAAAGLLFIALPLTQQYTAMAMAEIPVALFSFLAALSFGRYLDSGRWQDSARFAVFASLAIMTKGNALALALVPPLAIVLGRKFDLVARPSLWFAGILAGALCGPWYVFTMKMVHSTWLFQPGLAFTAGALVFNLEALAKMIGPLLLAIAMVGIYAELVRPSPAAPALSRGKWAATGALLLAVFLFQSVVPAGLEQRLLVPALPPLILFVIAGSRRLLAHPLVAGWKFPRKAEALALALLLVFATTIFAIPKSPRRGFGKIAGGLVARPEFRNAVFLVSSQTDGEGILISGIAMREKRPGHIVLRASKMLAASDWVGRNYRTLYKTPDEVLRVLDSVPVSILILDLTPAPPGLPPADLPHNRQLLQMLKQHPERWTELATAEPPGSDIRVYHLLGNEKRARGAIRIDMRTMLGAVIGN